jgi:hypothetical protein
VTGERAWTAPEMTPPVDADAEREALEDRRGVIGGPGATDEPSPPGEVPGLEGEVEGRSRLGTTSGPDRTDEGDGAERPDDLV